MKHKINFLKNRTTALLKQGLAPKELIESILFSSLLSVIPILGISTFLITTVSIKRNLNLPIMIALSYLLWPVQIVLIIPFIRVGEFIFSVPHNHHTVEEIISSFQSSFFQTLNSLSFELLCGLGGWLLTAVPLAILLYGFSMLLMHFKQK